MAKNENLERYLVSKRPASEEYFGKLRPFKVTLDQNLCTVNGIQEFRDFLLECKLTKYQIAGVTRIFNSAGLVVNREKDKAEIYYVTVGDVRRLSDEDLSKLTGVNGVRVLRALFGHDFDES